MICDREAPTGSHRVEVLCMTLAAWMERERDGQEAMRRIDYNKTAQKID